MIGIYKISDKDGSYIGKSFDIMRRWRQHMEQAETALPNVDFFHYLLKQFPENFKFEITEICTAENLSDREIYYINLYKPKYNQIKAANQDNKFSFSENSKPSESDICKYLSSILEKPLFEEDRKEIIKFFNYQDARGRQLKWNTVRQKIVDNGFSVMNTRRRDFNGNYRSCSIISLKFKY